MTRPSASVMGPDEKAPHEAGPSWELPKHVMRQECRRGEAIAGFHPTTKNLQTTVGYLL
jgi:hypothetical protein